jgi:two-component system phosphate regulon response regulator PhoB
MPSRGRIAVVEDEAAIAEVLQYNLEREGFQVDCYLRGDEAWEALPKNPPDLVLLDLMLPGLDGLELARRLRREKATADVPILMLTARTDDVDRIVGFELGADDYISKPFNPREVVLRVQAVLRRMATPGQGEQAAWLEAGGVRLDPEGHVAEVDGEEVRLTATEFKLLESLLRGVGRVKTRDALLEEVWEYSPDVDTRTVDTHIRRLRKKLGSEAERIETVIGVGYRMKG